MAPDEPEIAFKVTDRRRRGDDEPAPSPEVRREPAAAPRPAPPPEADDSGRSLVGLFMMLALVLVVTFVIDIPGRGH